MYNCFAIISDNVKVQKFLDHTIYVRTVHSTQNLLISRPKIDRSASSYEYCLKSYRSTVLVKPSRAMTTWCSRCPGLGRASYVGVSACPVNVSYVFNQSPCVKFNCFIYRLCSTSDGRLAADYVACLHCWCRVDIVVMPGPCRCLNQVVVIYVVLLSFSIIPSRRFCSTVDLDRAHDCRK